MTADLVVGVLVPLLEQCEEAGGGQDPIGGPGGAREKEAPQSWPAAEPGPLALSCPSSLGSWQPLAELGLLSSWERGGREVAVVPLTGGHGE